jgi:hypothetical protein
MKRKKKTTEIKSKIEKQELIAEVKTKSYEFIRCHKVKYIGNEYSFIDLRFYQADQSENTSNLYPTRKGVQMKEELFDKIIKKYLDHMIKLKGSPSSSG